MMLRRKTLIRTAAVLALTAGGVSGLAVAPAYANAPPAGWSFEGNWSTLSGCLAGGEAGEAAHEWTEYGCYQWPPGLKAPWGLYVH
jgi:hypothetical protein